MTEADKSAAPEPRRRRRWLRGLLFILVLLAIVGSGVAWTMAGKPLSAPGFLRAKVETRIADALPGLQLRFGDLSATVETTGATRVALRDVDVTTRSGAPVAQLADLDLDLAPWPLLRGEIQVTRARLSGAVLTVTRTENGRIALAFGEMTAAGDAAPDLPAMIAGLGPLLDDPALQSLERVAADGVTLRYEDLRAGRGWTVDSGRLLAEREGRQVSLSGDLALLNGGADVTLVALNAQARLGEGGLNFGFSFENMPATDIARQAPALVWLDALDAPISGALRSQMLPDGSIGDLNATLTIGTGVLQPNSRTRAIPFEAARTYFTYRPDDQSLTFSEIHVDSAWGRASAFGRAYLRGMAANGWPREMVAQVTLEDVEANPDGFFDTALTVPRAEMDLSLELDPFHLKLGRMRLAGDDLPLRLKGDLRATSDGWALSLDGRLRETTPETVARYWPPALVPKTRTWFTQNVLEGQLSDIRFAVRAEPGQKPLTHLAFDFADVALRYAATMPVARAGEGRFSLLGHRLVATADRAEVTPPEGGTLTVTDTHFVIPDVRQRPATGAVDLTATGPLTAVLSLINSEKLAVMDKAGLPVALGQGQVQAHGQLLLPLKKGITPPELSYSFDGTLARARTDQVVPNRTIEADSLAFRVDPTRLAIEGRARLDGVAFEGRWEQPLSQGKGTPSRLNGEIELSQRFVDAFGIGLPPGSVRGEGRGRVALDGIARGRAPDVTLTSDLSGLRLALPAIGWSKAAGTSGALEIRGILGAQPRIDKLSVSAPGLSAEGDLRLRPDRTLDRIAFSKVRVGNWLDAPVILRGRGRGAAPGVTLTGGSLDMRGLPASGTGAGGPVSLSLDRLVLGDTLYLSGFQGEFTTRGGLTGDFSGSLRGAAPLSGSIAPHPNGSQIRLAAQDGGRVLSALGLLKKAQGGPLQARLTSTGRPGSYDGVARIAPLRMQDAPAVASLLNAMSVVGLLDQLAGPGIAFTEVDAEFRVTPSRVIVTRSAAVGPSMGLSLDGIYDIASARLDMQGVLSPIYLLNGIGAIFTRRGEGLIGFNFALQGPAARPQVSVNPFSVLTPGMFREIFRRPPPKLTD